MSLFQKLIPPAFAMFIVILAQSATTSRTYAIRYNERLNEDLELIGLGAANIGVVLSGTLVVNGSRTITQMVDSAGGHSQLAQLIMTLNVLMVLLFLTASLAYLPEAVLSAVVFLIDINGMCKIYAERPWEFWATVVVFSRVRGGHHPGHRPLVGGAYKARLPTEKRRGGDHR